MQTQRKLRTLTKNAAFLAAGWMAAIAPSSLRTVTAAEPTPLKRFEFTEPHMAVDFRIVLYAPDATSARQAADAAIARIKQIDAAMSDYDADSELSRLSRTSPAAEGVHVSDDLWRVLQRARLKSELTDGAFDVTVGPLVKLWRRARRTGKLPEPEAIEKARESVGYRAMELDAARHTVRLVKPDMQLDLGGIAKGYAVDAALAAMRVRGINSALVAGSGDIGAGAAPPDRAGWRIGIAPLDLDGPPTRFVLLSHAAISTSGDSRQHVDIGGKRYSHIIDPKTGMALTGHSSVTVIASECTTTDGLTSGSSVMGPRRALEMIERIPGAAAYIVRRVDGKTEAYESSRFHSYEAPPVAPAVGAENPADG
jgi:thiamine biosynthesis lipoprotein